MKKSYLIDLLEDIKAGIENGEYSIEEASRLIDEVIEEIKKQ